MRICMHCGSAWATPEMGVCLKCDKELREMAELTPKQALLDFDWLLDHGYWEHFSVLEFTRRHWQPMRVEEVRYQLSVRSRFNSHSKPRNMAAALKAARQGYHRYLLEKATGQTVT